MMMRCTCGNTASIAVQVLGVEDFIIMRGSFSTEAMQILTAKMEIVIAQDIMLENIVRPGFGCIRIFV